MYKLIALDLDGTLKNNENEISDRTQKAVIACEEKGIKIVLASGRSNVGMRHEAKSINLSKYGGYLLSYNGANLCDANNEQIYSKVLDAKEAQAVYTFASQLHLTTLCHEAKNIITDFHGKDDKYVIAESKYINFDICAYDNLAQHFPKPIYKLLISGEPDYLAKCEERFKIAFPHLSIYRSMPFFLECMATNINKGNTLAFLCEQLNIDRTEVMAFGDGYNDSEMLKYAGLGVAMENGVDELKRVSDLITLSNDNDGIAEVLEKYILNT